MRHLLGTLVLASAAVLAATAGAQDVPVNEHAAHRAAPKAKAARAKAADMPVETPAQTGADCASFKGGDICGGRFDQDFAYVDDPTSLSSAFGVLASFTNAAFWQGRRDDDPRTTPAATMQEHANRLTIHGIYLSDASQQADDARRRAKQTAAGGCDEGGAATALGKAYDDEYAALQISGPLAPCVSGHDKTDWDKCLAAAAPAVAIDACIRGADQASCQAADLKHKKHWQALGNYLAMSCLSAEDHAYMGGLTYPDTLQLPFPPCDRGNSDVVQGRCQSARYGIDARMSQLRRVVCLLCQVQPGSPQYPAAMKAKQLLHDPAADALDDNQCRDTVGAATSTDVDELGLSPTCDRNRGAEQLLWRQTRQPEYRNSIIFLATQKAWAAQKILDAAGASK